jgi:magnesium transporter
MLTTHTYKDITWIDLEAPTADEVKKVREDWHINEIVAEEFLKPTLKPRVDLYRDYIYLVLHFPAIRHIKSGRANQEIDFVVGKKFIVTTHYEPMDSLHEFSKIFEVNSMIDRGGFGDHAGYIFYQMLKNIYRGTENELDIIKDKLAEIENNTFSGREKMMVSEISKTSRDLIDIKRALRPHIEVLNSLETAGLKFFGREFDFQLRTIKDEFYRTESDLTAHAELLSEIRDTNNSLLTTKQNETVKNLAVIAFIALPIGIFTALLQIDTVSRPLVGRPGDFWVILAIQAALALILYEFSKSRKWL